MLINRGLVHGSDARAAATGLLKSGSAATWPRLVGDVLRSGGARTSPCRARSEVASRFPAPCCLCRDRLAARAGALTRLSRPTHRVVVDRVQFREVNGKVHVP